MTKALLHIFNGIVYSTFSYEAVKIISESEAKRRKYSFLEVTYYFTPIAVETSGVWANEALKFLQEVGRRIADVTEEVWSTSFLLQRLRLTIQRSTLLPSWGHFPQEES